MFGRIGNRYGESILVSAYELRTHYCDDGSGFRVDNRRSAEAMIDRTAVQYKDIVYVIFERIARIRDGCPTRNASADRIGRTNCRAQPVVAFRPEFCVEGYPIHDG